MKKISFYFIYLLIIIITINCLSCSLISSGMYANAEEYQVKANEKIVIEAINDFKENNPKYSLPKGIKFKDQRGGFNNLYYFIYFYFPDENLVLFTYIQPETKNLTDFYFVRVSPVQQLGTWKDINEDFDDEENEELKKKFEQRILNKIKERL